jgi:hypothetical protein
LDLSVPRRRRRRRSKVVYSLDFDLLTFPLGRTEALEPVLEVVAGGPVGAGSARAEVDRTVGRLAEEAGLADALGPVAVLQAEAVGRAGEALAARAPCRLVAVLTREAGPRAVAPVAADLVEALGTVTAGPRQALVYVELAILALEAPGTDADVAPVDVVAGALVQAGIVAALVDVDLAVGTLVPVCRLYISYRVNGLTPFRWSLVARGDGGDGEGGRYAYPVRSQLQL